MKAYLMPKGHSMSPEKSPIAKIMPTFYFLPKNLPPSNHVYALV